MFYLKPAPFHFLLLIFDFYSVLKLFTGLAVAALIAWKLIVINAIATATSTAAKNIHQLMLIR